MNNDVLIVEDHSPTAELEGRALARANMNAVIVSQVDHALALLKERTFVAILLDYNLPGGDSWAVVEAAELKRPPIPVVLVTGQGNELIASQAIERGVAHYLKKSAACWDQLPAIVERVTELAAKKEYLRVSEAHLRAKAEEAEKANKAKSEFLASMSHEIRTPLNAVIGFGHLLEQSHLTEDQRKYLKNIQFAGRALLSVVNNVLDLSKIEAGEMSVENALLDLPGLISNVIQMLVPQAKTKGIELINLPLAELPGSVTGDASLIRQILINLVSNSIKFTEAGHVVVRVIFTYQDAQHLLMRCEVEDTGIGLEPDAIQRLFQPFTQADTTINRRFGGTGLGLSISRRLVHLMGGKIGVTSSVGVGSNFWFEIPLKRELSLPFARDGVRTDEPERSATGSAPEGQQVLLLDGLRALVVDDCDVNLEIIRRMLELNGAIVTCCSDGASAVDHVRALRRQCDVVLMDVQMPVLDGNEATRCIRRDPDLQALPIIGLTAGTLLGDRKRSLDAGMNDFLSKPFDALTLLRKVRHIVQQGCPQEVFRS